MFAPYNARNQVPGVRHVEKFLGHVRALRRMRRVRVLDRRTGNPMSLSLIYMMIGRRLKLPITGIGFCCARAASGHAIAAPRPAAKVRREITR